MSDSTVGMAAHEHAADGTLMALLDGEPLATERALHAHVDVCASCSARLDVIRHRDRRLSGLLADADEAPPNATRTRQRLVDRHARVAGARFWNRTAVRAAAAIMIVAGVAAATPVGRIVVDYVRATVGSLPATVRRERVTGAAPATPLPIQPGTLVAFDHSGTTLVVSLATTQAGGNLELLSSGESRITARITSGSGAEGFVVLPGELRIVNAAMSTANYRVTVPGGVRVIALVGGDTVYSGTPQRVERVPLQRSRNGQ